MLLFVILVVWFTFIRRIVLLVQLINNKLILFQWYIVVSMMKIKRIMLRIFKNFST